MSQTNRYEFSAAGYRCWSSDAASTCGWGTTPQAYESHHAYLLMIQPRIYRIVPKTALVPTDHDRFRRLLADQLGERWHPMPTVSARPTNV